jgi:hypothetical protein
MSPSNGHELEIAREVDWLSVRVPLNEDALRDILAVLNFVPSSADHDFLHRYAQWRTANPIAK